MTDGPNVELIKLQIEHEELKKSHYMLQQGHLAYMIQDVDATIATLRGVLASVSVAPLEAPMPPRPDDDE